MPVSKKKPVAFYQQVAETLKEDILSGKFVSGERIGSQKELEDRFGVSKITIRKAIELLEEENLVVTIHGKGTFVKQEKVEQTLDDLRSLTDIIKLSGYNPEVKVIKKETKLTSPTFSKNDDGNNIETLYIERVHIIEGEPIALAQAYIPTKFGEKLTKKDLENNTIYQLLKDKCNVHLKNAEQSIEAYPANEELSKILEVPTGSPLLKAERLVYSTNDELVEKIIFYYRFDSFAFKVKLDNLSITPMWPTSSN
ncbi:GntR family transcriptional regulator [Oceanobacillus jeddahense]|uniref:GntR family transcriptional regulator n=1 Tax=Oceanobacillus jeddahense TaxID=1462527 RepID=A0ABY5JWN2_9BACI|nr:GntR family transcriptional regulator [Oceanobacillus jeddahense]UUI04189.1 GntR family transcriptional regulator [Oceanobacillus jeddahense]